MGYRRAMSLAERMERTQWAPLHLSSDTRRIERPELLVLGCDRPLSHLNVTLRLRAPAARVPTLVGEALALMEPTSARFFVPDTFERAPLAAALEDAGFEIPHVAPHARRRRADDPGALISNTGSRRSVGS